MRLALYQPDIAGNAGAVMRLCACLGAGLDLIGPFGFVLDSAELRRAAMDYAAHTPLTRHTGWTAFHAAAKTDGRRIVLVETDGAMPLHRFGFTQADTLLFGRESAGVPPEVAESAAASLTIPMRPGLRSLNLAVAAGIVLAEALRQLGAFPDGHDRPA